jgi:hypothetical protein
MAKVYVVVVVCFPETLRLVASAPRRQLRVLVEEVLWDEFD